VELQEEGKTKAGIKTKLCWHFPHGTCRKGEQCTFAHSEQELGEPYFEGQARPAFAAGGAAAGAGGFAESRAKSGPQRGVLQSQRSTAPKVIDIMSSSAADLGDLPPEFCVDMRRFRDPAAGELKQHDGRHPGIIRRLAAHPAYAEWARTMQERMDEFASGKVSYPFLVFFCNAGRHRSVAGSLILEYVAAQLGMGSKIEHRSLPYNHKQCGCEVCVGGHVERQAALALAWSKWVDANCMP